MIWREDGKRNAFGGTVFSKFWGDACVAQSERTLEHNIQNCFRSNYGGCSISQDLLLKRPMTIEESADQSGGGSKLPFLTLRLLKRLKCPLGRELIRVEEGASYPS